MRPLIGEPGGPRRLGGPPVTKRVPDQGMLAAVLEFVHPGNLGPLPPSPAWLAMRGEQLGLAKFGEFFRDVVDVDWYRRNGYI